MTLFSARAARLHDMTPIGRRLAATLALMLACLVALWHGSVSAQPQAPGAPGAQQAAGDPPGRAARLSDLTGPVWLYDPDANEWVNVDRNQPLTDGDRIATDTGSRAEITLGTTTLRLDAGTELQIVRLDDARFVVRLQGGSVAARVRTPQAAAEFELDSDEGRFRVLAPGRFRFDRIDQSSDVTVYAGQAVFENANTALPVNVGQHAQFWIDKAAVPQYAMVAVAGDAFSAWNDERDRPEPRAASAPRFVSPEMTGAEDLDRYGQWEQTPDYGAIWVPAAVPAGWAPYTTGHWAWVRPWGWTWVDDARWGFAPFHYGRWVNRNERWCWAPGSYVARPVYAPALVAWIGGPRVGLSLVAGGGAPVGWFPLAPREVYVPSYRASPRYVREVNITHVTNVTQITTIVNNRNGEGDRREFANRRFANAVTIVPAEVLTRRQPVGPMSARYRNDPQVRAFVGDTRPGSVMIAPPVATPPRLAVAQPAPRPPFAGRPGGFAGRPEGGRPEGSRPDVGRPDGGRPDGGRPDGGRPDVGRRDGNRPDGNRPELGIAQPGRPEAARPDIARPGAVPSTGAPAIAGGIPRAGTAAPAAAPLSPATGTAVAPTQPAGPPVSGRPGIVEPSTGRPGFRGRDGQSNDLGTVPRVAAPSPAQQRSGDSREPGARPPFMAREGRTAPDGGIREARPAPAPAGVPTSANPAPAISGVAPIPAAAPIQRGERGADRRTFDAQRNAEMQRNAESQRPAAGARAPDVPTAAPRQAEPRPVEVPRPQVAEPRTRLPENPRPRDDRRDERGERPDRGQR